MTTWGRYQAFRFLLLPLMAGSLASAGVISIQGPMPTVSVEDVSDLYALQFDISFDPTLLSLNSISEGPFLMSAGPTVFIPGTIDNVAGTAAFTADSLLGPGPGASGSGDVAFLLFTPKLAGISPITLSNVTLLDSSLNEIPVTIVNGSFGTPEPRAFWLVASCLAALVTLRRRATVS